MMPNEFRYSNNGPPEKSDQSPSGPHENTILYTLDSATLLLEFEFN